MGSWAAFALPLCVLTLLAGVDETMSGWSSAMLSWLRNAIGAGFGLNVFASPLKSARSSLARASSRPRDGTPGLVPVEKRTSADCTRAIFNLFAEGSLPSEGLRVQSASVYSTKHVHMSEVNDTMSDRSLSVLY